MEQLKERMDESEKQGIQGEINVQLQLIETNDW
jgi:hypothetical protein